MTDAARNFWKLKHEGLLHGQVVRSSVRHGRLIGLKLPSPKPSDMFVVDHRDCGGRNWVGTKESGRPILASRRVVHVGEPVAAVTAASEVEARFWVDAIEVEVEERPEVADVTASRAARVRLAGETNAYFDVSVAHSGRTADCADLHDGSVRLFETYNMERQLRSAVGAVGVLVVPDEAGSVQVFLNAGHGTEIKAGLALALEMPEADLAVDVLPDQVSGDADFDEILQLAAVTVLLAQKSGRACRLVCRSTDRLLHGSGRPAVEVELKAAFSTSGIGTGFQSNLTLDAGAYRVIQSESVMQAARQAPGPYRWQSMSSRALAMATNNTPDSTSGSEGFPQVVFAREQLMDLAARRLDLDGGEIRIRNLMNKSGASAEMLLRASEWVRSPLDSTGKGRGLGYVINHRSPGVDAVEVEVDPITWEVRVLAINSWRLRGSLGIKDLKINILKDLGLAGFEDTAAAAFGLGAYRPACAVEISAVQVHWLSGGEGREPIPRGAVDDWPATGAGSAFVSAVAEATGLRTNDLPLLPEVLVDLFLIQSRVKSATS